MSDPEFYLGRIGEEQFKIPSTTFLTHAAILGASGSGKTVVCKSIVEEAIRADIPIIAIDPKGDIGALGIGLGEFTKDKLLIHAEVEAEDRGGGDPGQIAEDWIELYQDKLEDSFGDEYAAIEKDFSDKVAVILITPKNSAGVQISLTPSFEKPPNYEELMTESPDALLSSLDLKIQLLLSRCGISTSSSTDNRVIFLSNLIRNYWEEGKQKHVSLDQLIDGIQDAPFEKVGSLEVDKFISKTKRSELARNINALMVRAVPGVDLDFDKMIELAKKKQKTPIIVFDLRKITDTDEKNNFVAEILGEVQRWVWSKGGTSRLRAILYFDELYGFMPAGALSPPSKTALLIILKQARAAGLGCVLATQNPGDLDYRGLSNIATWVLGRLATNQDIAKVEGALKPVFEGAGGTSEEFTKLMSQIRALKPGNFVAYNPKYGVNRLKTRWLLSLHKGPLTDNEIKVLTLRPPKPKKKSQPRKEIATAEAIEEAPEIDFEFSKKKPATGKITERFLIPKIPLKGKQRDNVIYSRLSISGNPEIDGFSTLSGKTTNFYSPLYYSTTLINIKRTIKEGSLDFPVAITEEMTRSFDLSKKIEWNATTIEGVHASSLPPTDLQIQPIDGIEFYNLDKEIISKLPDNIVWYFTQNPFKEAEVIYHQKLREFEKEEVEKLAGRKVRAELSKLSTQIGRLEERMENENRKVDETIIRLETLQAEKRARDAEGKSSKATERSIESSENKLAKHEEKIRELRDQIKEAESQRQDLMKEQQAAYEEFHNAIARLKSKGVPQDFLRPGKADVSISEKAIYWIPRLLVPITLSNTIKEGGFEKQLLINLNLYNGNADITCDGCGPQVSTENYYQSLLESEISPPTFICLECLKTFCSEHITFCSDCGKKACIDHSQECTICNKPLCTACGVVDESTGGVLCSDHSWKCFVCKKGFSEEVPYKMGRTEQKPVCEECKDDHLFTCPECGEIESRTVAKICDGCNKAYCPEHMSVCKKCEAEVCNECGRVKVKIKNEEVVARCVNCS
ncbi:MAG: helicase HerA domain-containing protein [Promethearchaeota archaeon]